MILSELQVLKYMFNYALLQECCQSDFKTIDSDTDLLKLIEAQGLDRIKVFNLLRILINSNKIVFLNDLNTKF